LGVTSDSCSILGSIKKILKEPTSEGGAKKIRAWAHRNPAFKKNRTKSPKIPNRELRKEIQPKKKKTKRD